MKAEETTSLLFSGESSSVELLTSIRLFGGEKNEYSEISIKGDEFTLSRKIKATPKRSTTQNIPAIFWKPDSEYISCSSNGFFKCSIIDRHGYLLTHGSGYEKIDSGFSGELPAHFKFATLNIAINFLPEKTSSSGSSLIIFLMQYDSSGNRISNNQKKTLLTSGRNLLSEKFEIHYNALNWKIALRLHGFIGYISIDSSFLEFSNK
jgi:hypothetical protein